MGLDVVKPTNIEVILYSDIRRPHNVLVATVAIERAFRLGCTPSWLCASCWKVKCVLNYPHKLLMSLQHSKWGVQYFFSLFVVFYIERGFSQMNLQQSDVRNRLTVQTVSHLLMISANGPPIESTEVCDFLVKNRWTNQLGPPKTEWNRPCKPTFCFWRIKTLSKM